MEQPQEGVFEWLLISGISVTFLLSLSVVFFISIYQRRLVLQQVILQKMETNYQKELLSISIQVQEAERKRIAEDLHDEVGAFLSTMKLYTSHLYDRLKPDNEPLIDKIIHLTDLSIQNLRNISHHILPGNLEKFGLIRALEELCNMIREEGSIKIFLDYNEEKRLNAAQEICLYRIAQELLNNSLKHSKATEIRIQMRFDLEEFFFSYQDNGIGCNLQLIHETYQKKSGLNNMSNRAKVMGARIDFYSEPKQGFKADLNCLYQNQEPLIQTHGKY